MVEILAELLGVSLLEAKQLVNVSFWWCLSSRCYCLFACGQKIEPQNHNLPRRAILKRLLVYYIRRIVLIHQSLLAINTCPKCASANTARTKRSN